MHIIHLLISILFLYTCAISRGFQPTGPSELERVLRRRRPDSEGQIGPIRERQSSSRSSSTPSNELALHLKRRSDAIEKVNNIHSEAVCCA